MSPLFLRGKIKRVLTSLSEVIPFSVTASELVFLTACVESNCGEYNIQLGGGPALGAFQIEPATLRDIWDRYLPRRPKLKHMMVGVVFGDNIKEIWNDESLKVIGDNIEFLTRNHIGFQVAIARVKYYMVPTALPDWVYGDDPTLLAEYWKQYYNTPLGKGTVEKAVQKYRYFT